MHCAQEAYLSCLCRVSITSNGKILVACRDAQGQACEVGLHHLVGVVVGVYHKLVKTIVTPSADSLVGGKLVSIPHETVEVGHTLVLISLNIGAGVTIVTVTLTCHCKYSIALVEQAVVAVFGIYLWAYWLRIEVAGTGCRTCQEKRQCGRSPSFHIECFHINSLLLIKN